MNGKTEVLRKKFIFIYNNERELAKLNYEKEEETEREREVRRESEIKK